MALVSAGSGPARSREQSEAIRLLEELRAQRTGLSVFSRALGGRFTSMVLEVRAEQSCVILDELVPAHGHDGMQPGLRLAAEGRLDGVPVSFECEVLQIDEDAKGYFYLVNLPLEVERRQRRQHHRVPAVAHAVKVSLAEEHGGPVDGEIVDLSAAGVSVRLPRADAERLARAREELDCRLVFGPEETLVCKFQLCRVIDTGGSQSRLLAGRLLDLTPAIERRIGQLVSQLERELVRKRPPALGER